MLVSHLLGRKIGKSMPIANKNWTKSKEKRKSEAHKTISQVKAIRAIGIDSAAYHRMDQLHLTEIDASVTARFWMVLQMLSGKLCNET